MVIMSSETDTEQNNDFICPSCEKHVAAGIKFCPSCGTPIVHAPGNDQWIGRIVAGKYRVEELIGEGGMGQVFKATQLSLDKSIVLKVLRKSLLSDARTVARFQREAKAASRLNHPNAIGIIDFGQDSDDALYIAMEYVQGKDLHQILTDEGPIPERRLIRIVAQMLAALSEAHAVGVIHRDLKPENIMIEQRRDQPDFVKVLDFGIAKLQEAPGSEGQALTRAGFVCGTPEYMSPEQASGAAVDPRSDLYSVGVILYQCLTGVLPFDADSPVALATMHLSEDPVPPRQKNPDIHCSDALEKLILKAMAKLPEERPQTADQFRTELLAIEKSQRAAAKREASARRHGSKGGGYRLDESGDVSISKSHSVVRSSVVPGASEAAASPAMPTANDTPAETAAVQASRGKAVHPQKGAVTSVTRKPAVLMFGLAAAALVVICIGAAAIFFGEKTVDPAQAVASGDAAFLSKDYAQAFQHYQAASRAEPSAEHTKREAMALLAMGKNKEFVQALKKYRQQSGGTGTDMQFVDRYLESIARDSGPMGAAGP